MQSKLGQSKYRQNEACYYWQFDETIRCIQFLICIRSRHSQESTHVYHQMIFPASFATCSSKKQPEPSMYLGHDAISHQHNSAQNPPRVIRGTAKQYIDLRFTHEKLFVGKLCLNIDIDLISRKTKKIMAFVYSIYETMIMRLHIV